MLHYPSFPQWEYKIDRITKAKQMRAIEPGRIACTARFFSFFPNCFFFFFQLTKFLKRIVSSPLLHTKQNIVVGGVKVCMKKRRWSRFNWQELLRRPGQLQQAQLRPGQLRPGQLQPGRHRRQGQQLRLRKKTGQGGIRCVKLGENWPPL